MIDVIHTGDALTIVKTLQNNSVNCIVTSPPYFGLRDYGVPGQIGLEETPQAYVAKLVELFREARRVLRDDGTMWVNLGDSYNSSSQNNHGKGGEIEHKHLSPKSGWAGHRPMVDDLPSKSLLGIPWRVAFGLQDDGWILRSDIIWHKPNPMPESVTDRPTKAHEYVFMFSKAKWVGEQPGRFDYITKEDARWLALFLDTEGNITVKRFKRKDERVWYGAQICFASTSKELVERARSIIGAGVILQRKGKNAPMYYYQLSNKAAADLLRKLYPYLIVKPRQAQICIYLQRLLSAKGRKRPGGYRDPQFDLLLDRLWQSNKECNHFGNPDLSYVPEPQQEQAKRDFLSELLKCGTLNKARLQYRALAKEFHPDLTGRDTNAEMQQVNAAWEKAQRMMV